MANAVSDGSTAAMPAGGSGQVWRPPFRRRQNRANSVTGAAHAPHRRLTHNTWR